MSTLRCLKMRLSVSSPSRSSQHLQERVAERLDVVDQLRRQVLVHAADAEIVGVHAAARGALVEDHQLLALLEAPQRRGQRADVERLGGDVEEMRQEPADLGIEHADQLPAPRHLDAEQLLGGEAERVLLVHRRDVVEPVEIGDRLQIGLVLDQLLGAAVQEADMRIDPLDHLAVELQHQAQHPVRRRMLRPEIDGEVAQRAFRHHTLSATFAAFVATFDVEAVPRHHETLVTPGADLVDAVVRLDLEGHLLADHLGAFDIDRHGEPGRRRGGVVHVDVHAEAALAGIEMRRHQLHAGPFHQPDHVAGGEHARHRLEVGHLGIEVRHGLVVGHAVAEAVREAGLERRLHLTSPSGRPSRRRAGRSRCPPTATGNRNCGTPGRAAPSRRRRASARRPSAPRRSR